MDSDKFDSRVFLNTESDELYNSTTSISISKQASRCLLFLISKSGTIVSKEDIIEECWARHGTFVSDVTVRQTFFNIRKALAQLELPADALTTVRGKGYLLATGYINLAGRDNMDTTSLTLQQSQLSPSGKGKASSRVATSNIKFFLICFFLFLSSVTARHLLMVHEVTYTEAGNYMGVSFYSQNGISFNVHYNYNELSEIIHSGAIKENAIKHVYMNNQLKKNTSLFACNKPIEDRSSECISLIGIGRTH
ncbi:TPA: transcriptional regulator [Enterobacter cancerogenus]